MMHALDGFGDFDMAMQQYNVAVDDCKSKYEYLKDALGVLADALSIWNHFSGANPDATPAAPPPLPIVDPTNMYDATNRDKWSSNPANPNAFDSTKDLTRSLVTTVDGQVHNGSTQWRSSDYSEGFKYYRDTNGNGTPDLVYIIDEGVQFGDLNFDGEFETRLSGQ